MKMEYLVKLLKHARFSMWGAMHYNRFDQFRIVLIPLVYVVTHPYHLNKREIAFLFGIRIPRIIVHKPSYTDIHINNPWNKLSNIDWVQDSCPF